MTRYLRRLAPLGALVAVAVAMSATPALATEVCTGGHKPPSPYCENIPPTAQTKPATNVEGHSATLNGNAGAGVSGGDPTTYFFQYGTTTAYGQQTTPHTLGACPSGVTPPSPYCTTPASQPVSANVSHLKACTTYHFRIVAMNKDGTTNGSDMKFTTTANRPIKHVKFHRHVRRGHKFKVKITLTDPATVTIKIVRHGHVVKTYHEGFHNAGTFTARVRAPRKSGKYSLRVTAKESCGKETVSKKLIVTGGGHGHH